MSNNNDEQANILTYMSQFTTNTTVFEELLNQNRLGSSRPNLTAQQSNELRDRYRALNRSLDLDGFESAFRFETQIANKIPVMNTNHSLKHHAINPLNKPLIKLTLKELLTHLTTQKPTQYSCEFKTNQTKEVVDLIHKTLIKIFKAIPNLKKQQTFKTKHYANTLKLYTKFQYSKYIIISFNTDLKYSVLITYKRETKSIRDIDKIAEIHCIKLTKEEIKSLNKSNTLFD